MIKTISFCQTEILQNIIKLHLKEDFECDVTYSKGNFYKKIAKPKFKFDLYPQNDEVIKANANNLPLPDVSLKSLVFDPPFCAGYTKEKPTGIIGSRFHGFPYMTDLYRWYSTCIREFARVLKKNGYLVIKIQDTVSSGIQYWSSDYICKLLEEIDFLHTTKAVGFPFSRLEASFNPPTTCIFARSLSFCIGISFQGYGFLRNPFRMPYGNFEKRSKFK